MVFCQEFHSVFDSLTFYNMWRGWELGSLRVVDVLLSTMMKSQAVLSEGRLSSVAGPIYGILWQYQIEYCIINKKMVVCVHQYLFFFPTGYSNKLVAIWSIISKSFGLYWQLSQELDIIGPVVTTDLLEFNTEHKSCNLLRPLYTYVWLRNKLEDVNFPPVPPWEIMRKNI